MDSIDKRVLEILLEDSRCTATDISKRINLSVPATNKRIAKLIESGIIDRFTIQINPKKIEQPVQAFIMLVVDRYPQIDELMDFVSKKKNVAECYAITGEYDYLLKVYAKDIEELEGILLELKEKKCVTKSHTIFALMEHKHSTGPLPN